MTDMVTEQAPLIQRYRAISKMSGGSLRETPFGVILFALAVHERTLALEIRRTHIRKTIILEDGIPFECQSNLLHETLAAFLVRRGVLSDFQSNECLHEAARRQVRLGEVLMERALLDAVGLYRALQQNLAQRLLECFTWADGEFRIRAEFSEPSSSMSINVPQLVFTGITKFAPREQIRSGVGPLLGRRLVLHPSPPVSPSSLKASSGQKGVMDAVFQRLLAGELLPANLIEDDGALRVLYALSVIGIVVPSNEPLTTDAPAEGARGIPSLEAAAASPAAPQAAQGVPDSHRFVWGGDDTLEDLDPLDSVFESLWVEEPVEIEIELAPDPPRCEVSAPEVPADVRDRRRICNEIMSDYVTHKDKDPFEFLGVPGDASATQIRDRYIQLCKKYAPWRFEAPPFKAVAEKADELLRAAIFAFDELKDQKRRKQLLAEREDHMPSRGRLLPSSHFASTTEELAETYCQRGYELMATGNFGAASDLFSLALDSSPENRSYAIELSYSHFRDSPSDAAQVLRELKAISNEDPRCVQAQLYAAEVAHALGELEAAEAYFLRGCEIWASGAAGE
jgi:hypothetical protein